jgi:hypothetical protein
MRGAVSRIVDDRTGDVLRLRERRSARIPAAQRGEEDVFLAPHHPFRIPGGAARVQHVVIVTGALAER